MSRPIFWPILAKSSRQATVHDDPVAGSDDEFTLDERGRFSAQSEKKLQQPHSDGDHGESQDKKVVLTEINEFVSGQMLDDEHQSQVKTEDKDVFSMFLVRHDTATKDVKEAKGAVKEDVPDEIIREVPIGKGLAGTLALLKERGTFEVKEDYQVQLERTDEFGRPLTQKEAFKRFSHRFHGKVPGKMKQEKRIKQYQKELKQKQMECSDAPSQSMEWMREAQTPYLVFADRKRKRQT